MKYVFKKGCASVIANGTEYGHHEYANAYRNFETLSLAHDRLHVVCFAFLLFHSSYISISIFEDLVSLLHGESPEHGLNMLAPNHTSQWNSMIFAETFNKYFDFNVSISLLTPQSHRHT